MDAPIDTGHFLEDPEELQELLELVSDVRPNANVGRIRLAYSIAEKAHAGQVRNSGEPYITHPLAVARILVDLRMDDDTIIAALLHDVVEDCPAFTSEQLHEQFGDEVAALVEAVTKLKLQPPDDASERQRKITETTRMAESMRKMLLAMAKDFRVMVIKLADRLHNMQTIDYLPPAKQTRISNETLDVYAPLAARLGIWQIKWRLEDYAFKVLHPGEYRRVEDLVAKSRGDREKDLNKAILTLKENLEIRGIHGAEVHGRPKHLYSIFNKMVKQGFLFEEILDLLALRVVVKDKGECYAALGVVHEIWAPMMGMFTDYIARPKPNGYQSLHTKVVGPSGEPLEVQIRTREMHEIAEFGVAAHSNYKEGKAKSDETAKLSSLRQQLFDWSSDAKTSSDFLRSLSTDLFSEQVFVFTPKGDVLDMPKDSTPIDFAFRVHSQLGLNLVGAKVNGVMVPLSHRLKNGDVVNLITRSNAQPSLDWLEFIKSSHARNKLRAHFRKLSKDRDAIKGREMLEKELRRHGIDAKPMMREDKIAAIAASFEGCTTAMDVLAKIGAGNMTAHSLMLKLRGIEPEPAALDVVQTSKTREGKLTLSASGMDNVMLKRGKCCEPVPGDEVVGYVTRGKGMMIHRVICPNVMRFQTEEPDRLVALDWPADGSLYAVKLMITSMNRQGLLMDISTVLGESKTNVVAARIRTLPNHTAQIEITIDVCDSVRLQEVMTKISQFSDVLGVYRPFGRAAKVQ